MNEPVAARPPPRSAPPAGARTVRAGRIGVAVSLAIACGCGSFPTSGSEASAKASAGGPGGDFVARAPDRSEVIRYAARSGEGTWRKVGSLADSLTSREIFRYALALSEAGMHAERLERLFEVARRMQDRRPQSRGYGNFRWRWSESEVEDFNAVEFCMQAGAVLWLRHREQMPARARAILLDTLDYATQGCLRHNVRESYTNIAIMNAQNLILLGEALGRPKVAEAGYERLDRVVLYTWEYGTHEYVSPTYYGVDLECLAFIERFCRRERGREQARALLDLFWTDTALNWFPPARKLAGAQSRTYDYLRGLGHLDTQLWVEGWLPGRPRGGTGAIYPALAEWQPSRKHLELAGRFPRLARQSWGIDRAQSRTHYLLRDVTLSTAGSGYGAMDMPLTVDLPGDRKSVRCYFIPDARGDPYGKKKIPAGAHQKARHLKPFWRAAQRKTDALGLVVYRSRDLPGEYETLESHFVMPREVDEIWIGERRVEFGKGEAAVHPVGQNEAVALRKGTAAVGVRVPWGRDLADKAASVALVDDGNRYGAVRLTVSHGNAKGDADAGDAGPARSAPDVPAGAAFWVRVGGGLGVLGGRGDDNDTFDLWRREFARARPRVGVRGDEVHVTVPGSGGPVSVGACGSSPTGGGATPAPSEAVLELDGEDVGRRILKDVEPVRSMAAARARAPVVRVSQTRGTYWEAEEGAVVIPMKVGQDEQASGGSYVWMPGRPGERGGSELGRVTWRLQVPRAGAYYLWGRVLSPTPDDDSFHVRAFTGEGAVLCLAEWHTGRHERWTWVRLALGRSDMHGRLALPAGEARIELRVREDGTKIDRLFIAPDSQQRPDG